jgi:ferredoxin
MPYIVTENCLRCRFTDCVEVCPVDCFYGDDKMLYIHPDECIDCGACEPACPVSAIFPDDGIPRNLESFIDLNRTRSSAKDVENITKKQDPLPTAEARKRELGF